MPSTSDLFEIALIYEFVDRCIFSRPEIALARARLGLSGNGIARTLLPETHLDLEGLEVVGNIGFDFSSHALSRPLFETIELLVDVHDCVCGMVVT